MSKGNRLCSVGVNNKFLMLLDAPSNKFNCHIARTVFFISFNVKLADLWLITACVKKIKLSKESAKVKCQNFPNCILVELDLN